jgi:UDP-glucuronate 4-epimerase
MQPGDVVATYADVSALQDWTGVAPRTSLQAGIGAFVEWYRHYYSPA